MYSKFNARRRAQKFVHLITANLVGNAPALVTLTYKERAEIGNYELSRNQLNIFLKKIKNKFDGINHQIRYIAIPEYQKRGEIHFHCLIWGFPEGIISHERQNRVIAQYWGHGFVDVINSDTTEPLRLARYLSKYFLKSYLDERFANKKLYVASRNINRPVRLTSAMISYSQAVWGVHPFSDAGRMTVYRSGRYFGRCIKRVIKTEGGEI